MTLNEWMPAIVAAGMVASVVLGATIGWIARDRRADAEIAARITGSWDDGRTHGWTIGYAEGYRDGKNNKKRRDSARDAARDTARPDEFAVGAERDLWGNPVDARRKRGTAKQTFPIDVKGTRR